MSEKRKYLKPNRIIITKMITIILYKKVDMCLTNYIFSRKIFCGFSLACSCYSSLFNSRATLTLACHRKRISIITHIVLLPQLRSLSNIAYMYLKYFTLLLTRGKLEIFLLIQVSFFITLYYYS